MSATPGLLAAAAGVGFGHAILPDHWMPLAVVGRAQRYSLARIARLSSLAAVAHVLVSLILGALIVVVGLQFRSAVEHVQNLIVGLLLIGTGIAFATLELSGRGHGHARHGHSGGPASHRGDAGHGHDDHPHGGHSHGGDTGGHRRGHTGRRSDRARFGSVAGIMVPFGAAASPDLTILPVFLAASTAGTAAALGSLVVFAIVTIGTIVGLTLFATVGGHQIRARWLDEWGGLLTAGVLSAIGGLVLVGAI
jgi:hypothetical protein